MHFSGYNKAVRVKLFFLIVTLTFNRLNPVQDGRRVVVPRSLGARLRPQLIPGDFYWFGSSLK